MAATTTPAILKSAIKLTDEYDRGRIHTAIRICYKWQILSYKQVNRIDKLLKKQGRINFDRRPWDK